MKNLFLVFIAAIIVAVTAPLVIPYKLIIAKRSAISRKEYLFNLAIGLDQFGGSYLYGKPDWTVSSYTHYLSINGSYSATKFQAVIDFVFGENHCRNSYRNEVRSSEEELAVVRGDKHG